jgi:hypothetical protein
MRYSIITLDYRRVSIRQVTRLHILRPLEGQMPIYTNEAEAYVIRQDINIGNIPGGGNMRIARPGRTISQIDKQFCLVLKFRWHLHGAHIIFFAPECQKHTFKK